MYSLPRRKVFTIFVAIVTLLTCVGYIVSPEAFYSKRPVVNSVGAGAVAPERRPPKNNGDVGAVERREAVSGRDPAPAGDNNVPIHPPRPHLTRSTTTRSVSTSKQVKQQIKSTTASAKDSFSASSVLKTTRMEPHHENQTKTPEKQSVNSSWSLNPKILEIRAQPNCGAYGFKANLENETVPMPPWTEGSIPFPSELTLPDPEPTDSYFARLTSDLLCYKKGTDLEFTLAAPDDSQCYCLPGFHGDDCGIPSPVWHAPDFAEMVQPHLTIRTTVRRIIQAIPVNHELDLTSVRAQELGDSVAATLLAEADFTAAGEPKDRFFERRAREDPSFLEPFRNRTILLRSNTFPPLGCENGWVSDRFSRAFIGKEGLPRLHGLQDDDFFLLFDADEIPRRDVLDFLRFYEGYGEPIAFQLRWFIYGFFWEQLSLETLAPRPTRIEAGCSVGMLKQVYGGDPYGVRHASWLDNDIDKARAYEATTGRRLRTFEIGGALNPAGYHCSWCFRDFVGLQIKLVSAQLADGPRWGNFKSRLEPDYLRRIVKDGEWFDGTRTFAPTDILEEVYRSPVSYKDFAPPYMLKNFDKFSDYLVNPADCKNQTLMSYYKKATEWAFEKSTADGPRMRKR